jgi:hypothetical protein
MTLEAFEILSRLSEHGFEAIAAEASRVTKLRRCLWDVEALLAHHDICVASAARASPSGGR